MGINEKLTAIADAIRIRTRKSEKLTLDTMIDEIDTIFESGYADGRILGEDEGRLIEYNWFWDSILPKGKVLDFGYAFGGKRWNDNNFVPSRTLVGSRFYRCFAESGIKNISQAIDATRATSSTDLQNMFYNADIVTISEFIISDESAFDSTTFKGCNDLKNLGLSGTIGKNGFDLSYATFLSHNSILSVLNACNKVNAGVTVTLPKKCINGGTTTELYIANNTELSTALAIATGEEYNHNYSIVFN